MSITMTTVILFAVFGVLLFLGVPISISIVASSIVTAMSTLSWDQITFITMQKMNSGVESFSLLAVPLFILAGNIMNNGGIAKRLVNFAQLFVGKIPGSMAQANILGNMLFGALSGSSVAAASAMGGCISPIEEENGYDPAYSAAANIASAPTGLLIPPTSAFIVYSTVAGGVSISTLFMAGYIPGILMGLCCMVVAFIGAKKAGMKATGIDHSQSIAKTVWDAVPSLLLIVIVIGGIVSGIFTATEGAGVAVLYCLILSIIYKSIDFKGFLGILLNSAKTSGIILFLISASSAMSFVMAYSGIPAAISNGLMSLTDNKYIIFLLMNIILLVIGMFMDITPAILIFTPDLPAHRHQLWHDGDPVRRYADLQYVPGQHHPAGRLGSVRRLRHRSCLHRAGHVQADPLLCGTGCRPAGRHLHPGPVSGPAQPDGPDLTIG